MLKATQVSIGQPNEDRIFEDAEECNQSAKLPRNATSRGMQSDGQAQTAKQLFISPSDCHL